MDDFPAFSEAEKATNMDKEGRVYRMFVPDAEISETQTLLEGTDMEIGDYYRRAFELGKKAARAQMEGKKVTIEGDGLDGSTIPQEEPEAWGSMENWPPKNGFSLDEITSSESDVTPNLAPNVHSLFERKNKHER